jgi:hypothetical protein
MGSRNSPLPLDVLLETCLEIADTDAKKHLVSSLGAVLLLPEHRGGEYYDTHAQDQLVLVRLHAACGENALAEKAWNTACQYLAGYGWHKDITIYELLDPLEILASVDLQRSRKCIHDIQPAVERVITHTDGKETRHAIHAWLDLAARFHPAGALSYLAHEGISDISDPGVLHHALPKALAALREEINLVHAAAGWLAAGSEARSEVQAAISACELAIHSDSDVGQTIWSAVVGSLDGDGINPADKLDELAAESAKRLGLPEPEITFSETKTNQKEKQINDPPQSMRKNLYHLSVPIFPPQASSLQIAHAIRQWYGGRGERPEVETVTNFIGWKVIEMVQTGNEAMATLLLERIARDTPLWARESLLPILAEGLNFYGEKRLAALMYTFAYTRASDGWRRFAGSNSNDLFSKALSLDVKLPWSILAEEVSEGIARGGDYGINVHMIELLAANGHAEDAFAAWDAACRVINYRLPPTGPYDEIENVYDDKCNSPADMLASTIVARINSRSIHDKRLALAATALVVHHDPSAFSAALRQAITNNAPSSTLVSLLHLMELFEQEPYVITKSTIQELYQTAACDLVSARVLARRLLERAGFNCVLPPPIPMPITTTISDDRITEIIEGIGKNRIQPIDTLWQGFSRYVAGRVEILLKSETLKEQMQHALRNVNRNRIGRHLDAWYPMDEEIERVLQTTGASVRSALAQEGVIDPDVETEVGMQLLSNLSVGVRLSYSRYVRPTYIPLPSALISGTVVSDIHIVPEGEFAGWIILAHHESELKIGSGYDKPVEGKTEVFSGIVFTNVWYERDGIPLGYGYSPVWFQNPPLIAYSVFGGPLAGLEIVRDPFGGVEVLVPHPIIPTIAHLTPSRFDHGLTLIDSDRNKAVVCRTWRRNYIGDEYVADQEPILQGLQLLIRPDIYDQVRGAAIATSKYVTLVSANESGKN